VRAFASTKSNKAPEIKVATGWFVLISRLSLCEMSRWGNFHGSIEKCAESILEAKPVAWSAQKSAAYPQKIGAARKNFWQPLTVQGTVVPTALGRRCIPDGFVTSAGAFKIRLV
jgi:hypothetical protein